MAKAARSNAERQRAYRERHLKHPDTVDSERINLVVSITAKRRLERLASYYGVTQRGLLDRVLGDAESAVLDRLKGKDQKAYYEMVLRNEDGAGERA